MARLAGPRLVSCVIADSGASSKSALEHAASLAERSCGEAGRGRLVAVICISPLLWLPEHPFGLSLIEGDARESIRAGMMSMIGAVEGYFGLTVEIEDIFASSQAEIIQVIRARGSDIVVLPTLGHDAGPVRRWRRRHLISGIRSRTTAIVIDEFERPALPKR